MHEEGSHWNDEKMKFVWARAAGTNNPRTAKKQIETNILFIWFLLYAEIQGAPVVRSTASVFLRDLGSVAEVRRSTAADTTAGHLYLPSLLVSFPEEISCPDRWLWPLKSLQLQNARPSIALPHWCSNGERLVPKFFHLRK